MESILHCRGMMAAGLLGVVASLPVAKAAEPPLFLSSEPLAITLTGSIIGLANDDSDDPVYRDVSLQVADASGAMRVIPVRVKPRGKSRRRETVCQFPPLRLNLPKQGAERTAFEGQDKLKLVTHCSRLGSVGGAAVERLWLEFLLYKAFTRVSATSLRVRSLQVTYVDADQPGRAYGHPAFVIEDIGALASRLDARETSLERVDRGRLAPEASAIVEVFQYFAGNTDFSLTQGPAGEPCCHNIKLLDDGSGQLVPVPYDFDATGVVNPPYARPLRHLGIRNVRQRLYRGYCRTSEQIEAAIAVFQQQKAAIYSLFADSGLLSPDRVRSTLRYIDAFYAVVDDADQRRKRILDRCL